MKLASATPYKPTKLKGLLFLNILTILFILFVFWESKDDAKTPTAGLEFIFLAPVFWVVWIWTFLADMIFIGNWLELKIRGTSSKQ